MQSSTLLIQELVPPDKPHDMIATAMTSMLFIVLSGMLPLACAAALDHGAPRKLLSTRGHPQQGSQMEAPSRSDEQRRLTHGQTGKIPAYRDKVDEILLHHRGWECTWAHTSCDGGFCGTRCKKLYGGLGGEGGDSGSPGGRHDPYSDKNCGTAAWKCRCVSCKKCKPGTAGFSGCYDCPKGPSHSPA